jgi:nucleoside-diphosphate-sugar epimerase
VLALVCSLRGALDPLTAGMVMAVVAVSSSGVPRFRRWKGRANSADAIGPAPAHVRSASSEQPPVLVIGGAGYIGSILVRRLIAAGRKVRVLDNFVYGNAAVRELFGHPGIEFLNGDCRNIKSVVGAVEGVDTIIHLAAIVGDPACEQERQTALETNYAATRMLIEVAKGARVRRLLFASTCSVYGASDELMHESSPVKPISLYAQTKVQSERALLESATEQFQPIILRLATVFGHSYRPRFDLVVNLLTGKAHQEGVITIYNGQQWRPFIHVRDVAEGMLMIMETPLSVVGGQIFNLGDSSMNYTLEQVAAKIREVYPGTEVQFVDNNDRRNYRVSFDKLDRLVGFRSSVDLTQGVQELQSAFERRQIEDYKLARYSNQCFLQLNCGATQQSEVDTYVMAAFSRHFQTLGQIGAEKVRTLAS